jgi:hypothetical protein
MDEVQKQLRPLLRARGYRSKARTFNRTTSDGLTHVITFQMARFDPPGTNYIPWFREKLYGRFTVNVGVHVPEVHAVWFSWSNAGPAALVPAHECCIQSRLGDLGPERTDIWWNLGMIDEAAADVGSRLERDGLPFLARFETRDMLLYDLSQNRDVLTNRSKTASAIVLAARGQLTEARQLLGEQSRQSRDPKDLTYLNDLALLLGLDKIET